MEFFLQSFAAIFIVMEPFSVVAVFVGLTESLSILERREIAKKACLISFAFLMTFAFIGDELLKILDISQPAFRITGGILLFLVGLDMVLAKHSGLHATNNETIKEASPRRDISIFPIAIPLIAGPGTLATMIIQMYQAASIGVFYQLAIVFSVVLMISFTYLILKYSDFVIKKLGTTGIDILTRVFGIFLIALSVQSLIFGFSMAFKQIAG
ncbi:MAG: MarC family protein [Alphaproteobacteria bacterium]|nr:MarC family protein [Alphaproteobacteria bacterium]